MIQFLPQNDGNLVAIKLSGTVTHEEFEALEPMLDDQIDRDGGSIALLLDLLEFEGYEDLHALWEHFTIVRKHNDEVKRIAVLGNREWERRFAELAVRLVVADVGYYGAGEQEQAIEFLQRA
jgi:hypothetical protein